MFKWLCNIDLTWMWAIYSKLPTGRLTDMSTPKIESDFSVLTSSAERKIAKNKLNNGQHVVVLPLDAIKYLTQLSFDREPKEVLVKRLEVKRELKHKYYKQYNDYRALPKDQIDPDNLKMYKMLHHNTIVQTTCIELYLLEV